MLLVQFFECDSTIPPLALTQMLTQVILGQHLILLKQSFVLTFKFSETSLQSLVFAIEIESTHHHNEQHPIDECNGDCELNINR